MALARLAETTACSDSWAQMSALLKNASGIACMNAADRSISRAKKRSVLGLPLRAAGKSNAPESSPACCRNQRNRDSWLLNLLKKYRKQSLKYGDGFTGKNILILGHAETKILCDKDP